MFEGFPKTKGSKLKYIVPMGISAIVLFSIVFWVMFFVHIADEISENGGVASTAGKFINDIKKEIE